MASGWGSATCGSEGGRASNGDELTHSSGRAKMYGTAGGVRRAAHPKRNEVGQNWCIRLLPLLSSPTPIEQAGAATYDYDMAGNLTRQRTEVDARWNAD